MTHYDVDYSGMTYAEKSQKAMADMEDWLGAEKFARIQGKLREQFPERPGLETLRLVMSFAGVQGFPVQVLLDELWPTEG